MSDENSAEEQKSSTLQVPVSQRFSNVGPPSQFAECTIGDVQRAGAASARNAANLFGHSKRKDSSL